MSKRQRYSSVWNDFTWAKAPQGAAAAAVEKTDITIHGAGDTPVFHQTNTWFPTTWSATARRIMASRWFRGAIGSEERETSATTVFYRVAKALLEFGVEHHYIPNKSAGSQFSNKLMELQMTQTAVFNTPVYLNAGWTPKPRCSACFLVHVEDDYESLTAHSQVEGAVFQHGGGAGVSVSHISHEGKALSRGGYASGPLTFNEGWDRSSGAIKSGGSHRRAARDVTMDVSHPDCYRNAEYLSTLPGTPLNVDFIREKSLFEKIRRDLKNLGYETGMNSLVDYLLPAQNSNRAVGITDDFMNAVNNQAMWEVRNPRDNSVVWKYPATEIWDAICQSAWECAEPTIKFMGTINKYNTCEEGVLAGKTYTGLTIRQSNPCNEVLYAVPPVSGAMVACNLAMQKLTNYVVGGTNFDYQRFSKDAKFIALCLDMLVDYSHYPNELTDEWTKANRIIGLSFSDLGGALMRMGLPYASVEGRTMAASIAALQFASVALMSAQLADRFGACSAWEHNKHRMMSVLREQQHEMEQLQKNPVTDLAIQLFMEAMTLASETGFRNMQFTVLAPQGTTGLITDCDSTGGEPLISLKSFKQLSGGGQLSREEVPESVIVGMQKLLNKWLTYQDMKRFSGVKELISEIIRVGVKKVLPNAATGAPTMIENLLKTALGTTHEDGSTTMVLTPSDHIQMVAAIQPFVSGGISKTINLPNDATVEDVSRMYKLAHALGVKCISIYRDGCKGAQPVTTKKPTGATSTTVATTSMFPPAPPRCKLPIKTATVRYKLDINGHEAYLHVGVYPSGQIGEIFLTGIEGSFLSGMLDAFARSVSISLQYQVPFDVLLRQFENVEFSPNGYVPGVGNIKSFPSYIFMLLREGIESGEFVRVAANFYGESLPANSVVASSQNVAVTNVTAGINLCSVCGSLMIQTGTCATCTSCGNTSGGC